MIQPLLLVYGLFLLFTVPFAWLGWRRGRGARMTLIVAALWLITPLIIVLIWVTKGQLAGTQTAELSLWLIVVVIVNCAPIVLAWAALMLLARWHGTRWHGTRRFRVSRMPDA